jgi:CubicO group peptidase (beta-lactamase class C family)
MTLRLLRVLPALWLLPIVACGDDATMQGEGSGGATVGTPGSGPTVSGATSGAGGDAPCGAQLMVTGDERLDALAATVEAWRVAHAIPGVALAVSLGDSPPDVIALGVRDPRSCEPVTANSRIRDGLVSWRVTELLALAASRSGLVDLDAPIADLVDVSVAEGPHGEAGDITLAQLVSSTSGLAAGWFLDDDLGEVCGGDGRLSTFFGSTLPRPLWGPPGAQFMGSMLGYALAGHVLAAAGGQPYRELAQEMVLGPLGVDGVYDPAEAEAGDHMANPNGEQETGCEITEPNTGLYTSIEGIHRLYQAMARRELGDAADYDDLYGGSRPLLSTAGPQGWSIGAIPSGDSTLLTTLTSWDGVTTSVIAAPERDFLVVVSWITSGSGDTAMAPARAALQAYTDLDLEAFDHGASDLEQYAGTYVEPIAGDTWQLSVVEGELVADRGDGLVAALRPASVQTYQSDDGDGPHAESIEADTFIPGLFEFVPVNPWRFHRDAEGTITHFAPMFTGMMAGPPIYRVVE